MLSRLTTKQDHQDLRVELSAPPQQKSWLCLCAEILNHRVLVGITMLLVLWTLTSIYYNIAL